MNYRNGMILVTLALCLKKLMITFSSLKVEVELSTILKEGLDQ
jgi:hypothetical protein